MKKLILIDGNAIMHRSFHALPPLTTKKGELVNAVYGFASTLLSVVEKFQPDYVAATFDLKGPTFRHEQFKEYKATRVAAPDEFYSQIPRVKEVVRTMNIPIYEKTGFEADDMIGTLSAQAEKHEGLEVIIVTGDMDTLQLVSSKTKVYTMRRGLSDSVLYDQAGVMERYGLSPDQVVDLKGLAGDPSDNIPGVKGIGQKTATTLLQKYQTVEGVYDHLGEIKGAAKEKLERDKAQAFLSKQLATILCTAPVELDLEATRLHDFDRSKMVALLTELNFYSLVKRLPGNVADSKKELKSKANKEGVKDFKYSIIQEKEAEKFLKELSEQKELAIAADFENSNQIKGLAISWKAGRAGYLTWNEKNKTLLKTVLEDEAIAKVGYDLKKIYKALKRENILLANINFDILVGAYLLNPGGKLEFETLVMAELGEEVDWAPKKKQLSMLGEEADDRWETTSQQADYALKIKEVLAQKIDEVAADQKNSGRIVKSIEQLFREVELPLVEILGEMELWGVKFDRMIFDGIVEKLNVRLANLEKNIYKLAGREFNINSPSQLAEVLFVDLKLPTANIKKGKTGYSTASAELEKLRSESPMVEKVEEYRELFKLKTTYLDTLPELCDEHSRIHSSFNQAVAATGRLSSADPNLQNIPIRSDLGQLMRTAFGAEPGYKLVSADYSQIDLRAVAHVSEDKNLIEAFHRGDDIHRLTASVINQVTPSQVTDKMRSAAKALNFSIIYGVSAFSFSQYAGIDRGEAQKFINEYFEKFSGVAKYMKDTKEFAKKNGYVETLFGRRRYIPEINSPNFQVASAAERMAINMPIQGLSADIVKLAMVACDQALKNNSGVRMILQIHDEIIWEVKEEIVEEMMKQIKDIMENVVTLRVPLIVDVSAGDNWGEI